MIEAIKTQQEAGSTTNGSQTHARQQSHSNESMLRAFVLSYVAQRSSHGLLLDVYLFSAEYPFDTSCQHILKVRFRLKLKHKMLC